MTKIRLIAVNTFRQTIRDRLYYNIVLFGVGMVVFSMVVGNLTFGHPDRVVRSIGHSGIVLALDLTALLLGVSLVYQEIDRRSLFVVLTRPLTRFQYVAGRFLGLLAAVGLVAFGLSLVFAFVLVSVRGHLSANDLLAIVSSFSEAAVLGALGLLLSTVTTPTLGAGLGLGSWIIMASTDDLVALTRDNPFGHQVAKVFALVFPSTARLDFRENAVYGLDIALGDYLAAVSYGGLQAALLVVLAGLVLSRREML